MDTNRAFLEQLVHLHNRAELLSILCRSLADLTQDDGGVNLAAQLAGQVAESLDADICKLSEFHPLHREGNES